MMAMIFEFWFDSNRPAIYEEYLHTSETLRTSLDLIEGFHGVERFRSCSEPSKFVALAFFDDEEAVRRWRILPTHRRAQTLGRTTFFTNYRLRMAEVVRDYGPSARHQAPTDSRSAHDVDTKGI